jgi:hypothetical protein
MIGDHFGLAAQVRYEYISITGSGDSTPGRPANGALSVIGRLLYYLDLGVGNAQIQFSADFGGGDGYRFAYPPTNPRRDDYTWDPSKPTILTDTTRSGPLVYGGGTGFIYHFNQHFALNAELRMLAAGPHFGLIGEFFGSLQFAIGGKAPEVSRADAPPKEPHSSEEEDESGEEE